MKQRIFLQGGLITLLLVTAACKKSWPFSFHFTDQSLLVFGHAGMGDHSVYPRNSLASLMKCLTLNTDGTEFDIQLTSDNVLVAFHDEDLSWSTNMHGIVRNHTYDELKNASYKYGPYNTFKIVSVETLFEQAYNKRDARFSLDCKLYSSQNDRSYYTDFVYALKSLMKKFNVPDKLDVESSDPDFLKLVKENVNDIGTYFYANDAVSGTEICSLYRLTGISISNTLITADEVKSAHEKGYKVILWDVHSKSDHENALRKYADMIQSDDLRLLIQMVK